MDLPADIQEGAGVPGGDGEQVVNAIIRFVEEIALLHIDKYPHCHVQRVR